MNDIDIFYNSEIILRRSSFEIRFYIVSMFILLTVLLTFMSFFQYNPYITLKATVIKDDESYYLKTLVIEKQINDINQNSLIINNKKHKYKIKNISNQYILDEKYNKYYEVLIGVEIEERLIINNNIIDINIELDKTNYLKQIIKKIKKGMK